MATMDKSDREIFKEQRCSFCNTNRPVAHWTAEVFTCRRCAVEVLPVLIADASLAQDQTTLFLRQHWDACASAYWQAVATRFMHESNGLREALKFKEAESLWLRENLETLQAENNL